ncbi:Protein CBG27334 [Caenorhabditis briggsae]|uniref:Protein CBG27334 n=1 Tax=Caenorhabditis briggsae TaxID=6238 RepID=B6IG66_CAEBR|nr:Protein CBG27334 [Caenorhabditis briggsae]CAR98896.1 Protein CBG27334 [Caenorhabditis briggsae]
MCSHRWQVNGCVDDPVRSDYTRHETKRKTFCFILLHNFFFREAFFSNLERQKKNDEIRPFVADSLTLQVTL